MFRQFCNYFCKEGKGCVFGDKKIVGEGYLHGVDYLTLESCDKKYIVIRSEDYKELYDDDLINFIPKYGKFEIEKFIAHKVKEALFISHDLTDLFNTYLICFDVTNTTCIDASRIKESVMKCFDIVKETNNVVWLKFKCRPYVEIEKKIKEN